LHHTLSLQTSALLAATRHHPELDGTLLTLQSSKDFTDLVRASRIIFGGAQYWPSRPPGREGLADPPPKMDATEVDVLRVFTHVVAHRLRVRDGPADELLGSMAYGVVQSARDQNSATVIRRTIRDILKDVLSAV
jgi:hypothetical protein